jgi:uncharacterized membrane protein
MVSAVLRHGHHGIFGIIILLILVGAVVIFVISRGNRRRSGDGPISATNDVAKHDVLSNAAPERILSERFAKGEIGLDEYSERLKVLRATGNDSVGKS